MRNPWKCLSTGNQMLDARLGYGHLIGGYINIAQERAIAPRPRELFVPRADTSALRR